MEKRRHWVTWYRHNILCLQSKEVVWTSYVKAEQILHFNPLSAIWRIYPSSKWSSQLVAAWRIYLSWVNDKLWACEGLGHSGMFWGEALRGRFSFEARNYLFSFPSYVHFEEFFCFPRFCKIWRQTFLPAFGFDDVLELFLKTALRHSAFSCELRLRPQVFFENFFSFFKAEPVLLAWQLWWSPGWAKLFGGGSSKTRVETWFRELARSIAEGPSIVVAFSTSRLRWSMVQKRQKPDEVSLWLSFIVYKNQRGKQRALRSPFPRPNVFYRFAIRCFPVCGCTVAPRVHENKSRQLHTMGSVTAEFEVRHRWRTTTLFSGRYALNAEHVHARSLQKLDIFGWHFRLGLHFACTCSSKYSVQRWVQRSRIIVFLF